MHQFTTRRGFLYQTVGVACGFSLVNTLAPPAEAQIAQFLMDGALWLGKNVLTPAAVTAFGKWLENSQLFRKPEDGSFHDHFNPGVAFDKPFPAQPTRWTGYMGVDGLPALSHSSSLSREGELNLAEVEELKNDRNPNLYYGGRLRLAPIPNGLRVRPTYQDFDIVGYDLIRSGEDPQDYRVEYAREFCDCSGMRLRGYGWSSLDGEKGFRILQV
jgi:hypothetical protein